MNIDLNGRMYKVESTVYLGYTPIKVHNQRGRLFVNYKGRQLNLNNIPYLPKEDEKDSVFDYVFGGLFQEFSCHAVDYWILRWRLKTRISYIDYKLKYIGKKN